MAIANKNKTPVVNATTSVLSFTGTPITTKQINAWVNTNASGNFANVNIIVLPNKLNNNIATVNGCKIPQPINFGFTGGKGKHHAKFGGTRAFGLNLCIFGVYKNAPAYLVKGCNASFNLNAVINVYTAISKSTGAPHSNFLWFVATLLNGTTSTNNVTSTNPIIKLQAVKV